MLLNPSLLRECVVSRLVTPDVRLDVKAVVPLGLQPGGQHEEEKDGREHFVIAIYIWETERAVIR